MWMEPGEAVARIEQVAESAELQALFAQPWWKHRVSADWQNLSHLQCETLPREDIDYTSHLMPWPAAKHIMSEAERALLVGARHPDDYL